MFYNVYLRVSESGAQFSDVGVDFLYHTHKVPLLDAGAKFTFDPEIREMGDGTPRVTAETVALECASLRVTLDEYDYLRTYHHNMLSDILFLDPHDMSLCIAAYRMRLNIQLVAKSKEVALINITGQIQAGSSVIDTSRTEVFALDSENTYGLVEGRVIDEKGEPLSDATVALDTNEHTYTNYAGEFSLMGQDTSTEIAALLSGYVFLPVAITVTPGQVLDITIQEEKD